MPLLERDEYVEQAYFFKALGERLQQNMSTQDLLSAIKEEILTTTKLPMALDYLAAEIKHIGLLAPAMAKLAHYFTAFQTFVVTEAENDRGRFDFAVAVTILHKEAAYRATMPSPQGLFLYQFETLCRNRLRYDHGLDAMAKDPVYEEAWREWLNTVRRQIGLIDLADLIYVRSAHYLIQQKRAGRDGEPEKPVLFGEKEGKISLANRQRDPLFLFSALQRHLGYPEVARPKPVEETWQSIPNLIRRMEKLEARLKLLEEEQVKGGIDLTKFYRPSEE